MKGFFPTLVFPGHFFALLSGGLFFAVRAQHLIPAHFATSPHF
jgi:hypothetical protein